MTAVRFIFPKETPRTVADIPLGDEGWAHTHSVRIDRSVRTYIDPTARLYEPTFVHHLGEDAIHVTRWPGGVALVATRPFHLYSTSRLSRDDVDDYLPVIALAFDPEILARAS